MNRRNEVGAFVQDLTTTVALFTIPVGYLFAWGLHEYASVPLWAGGALYVALLALIALIVIWRDRRGGDKSP
jgi:hypothetical protein